MECGGGVGGTGKRVQFSGHVIGSILFYLLEGANQACLLLIGVPLRQLLLEDPLPSASLCCGTTRTQQIPGTCGVSAPGGPEGAAWWTEPRN